MKDALAPSLDDFIAIGEAAFDTLPALMRDRCDRLVIRVADFADDEVLDEMGIEDAFELTGLYSGVDLTQKSVDDVAATPDEVWLYRRPILDEWAARGDVTLEELIAHVLVHEIAHHFGMNDDQIARIDDWREW